MSFDPVVLSFHDALLRESDIKILQDSQWLNNRLIGFFFEYMAQVVCQTQTDQIAFLCPEVTQFIKYSNEDDMSSLVQSLGLDKKLFIFIAINDCAHTQGSPGGSHWSLLVFSRPATTFYHCDSFHGFNEDDAWKVMEKLKPHLLIPTDPKFTKMDCPQQRNGHDCGLHLIVNAEILTKHFIFGDKLVWCTNWISKDKRADLKNLIEEVKKRVDNDTSN